MRKKMFFFLVFCLFILSGCSKKENNQHNVENSTKIEKKNQNKDYIYFDEVKTLLLNNGDKYVIQYPIVNFTTEESNSVNLELKSVVNKNYRALKIENDKVKSGNILMFESFESDKYVSLVQTKKYYLNDSYLNDSVETYVFSKENGVLLPKEKLLESFNYDENSFFEKISTNLDSDDVSYSLMMIKQSDYRLYVKNNKLILVYYDTDNENEIKKEMIIE